MNEMAALVLGCINVELDEVETIFRPLVYLILSNLPALSTYPDTNYRVFIKMRFVKKHGSARITTLASYRFSGKGFGRRIDN